MPRLTVTELSSPKTKSPWKVLERLAPVQVRGTEARQHERYDGYKNYFFHNLSVQSKIRSCAVILSY